MRETTTPWGGCGGGKNPSEGNKGGKRRLWECQSHHEGEMDLERV